MVWIAFGIGLFVGANIGVVVAAVCFALKKKDLQYEMAAAGYDSAADRIEKPLPSRPIPASAHDIDPTV